MENDTLKSRLSATACTGHLVAVGDALYVIGGKWKLRIIIAISEGTRRFNELQRTIPGISAKVLSNELKDLELNGFVKRTVHTGIPVVVEYEATDYIDSLRGVIEALSAFGKSHKEKLQAEGQ